MKNFILTSWHKEWLMRRAEQSAPQEACGFILRDGRFIEIPNSAEDPNKAFSMTTDNLYRRLGDKGFSDVLAIWHTHPSNTLELSDGDKEAILNGHIDPNWCYFIATKDNVSEFDCNYYKDKELFFESFCK